MEMSVQAHRFRWTLKATFWDPIWSLRLRSIRSRFQSWKTPTEILFGCERFSKLQQRDSRTTASRDLLMAPGNDLTPTLKLASKGASTKSKFWFTPSWVTVQRFINLLALHHRLLSSCRWSRFISAITDDEIRSQENSIHLFYWRDQEWWICLSFITSPHASSVIHRNNRII